MIVDELQFNKKHTGAYVDTLGLWFKAFQMSCFSEELQLSLRMSTRSHPFF